MIANEQMTRASLVMWKSKQIDRVCHSSKDAETLVLSKMLDEVTYLARLIETLLFEEYKQRILVRIYTDSEPSLESIISTKQIERKSLQIVIQDLKERLMDSVI